MSNRHTALIDGLSITAIKLGIICCVSSWSLFCEYRPESVSVPRFELLPANTIGIDFANLLTYTEENNPYTFKSFYNGGGVGIGDLDNDGLLDLVFAGNQVDNSVYRNLGSFTFEDVTELSGLASPGGWTTGVSIADVNGDGWLDIFLCKSGPPQLPNRHNELLINNRNGTFTNIAQQAGVDDFGFSVQAAFFDYDQDGDLDLYLLNNSIRSIGGYDIRPGQRNIPDSVGSNKLYRNNLVESSCLTYTDVSEKSGIFTSNIGFGLGVSVVDVNIDGWPDLYIANDFFERDYLYINNGGRNFTEILADASSELSLGAMGVDAADLDGDVYPEIFVSEMRPNTAKRLRSKSKFETWTTSRHAERMGYHRQYSRNTLFKNEGGQYFADVARSAGVEATDWSWGALLADLDNSGRRDLYVANGIYKDLLDQDYINFVADQNRIRQLVAAGGPVITSLIDSMPSVALPNIAFANLGELAFVDSTVAWGLDQPSFSNGSAYGDLDNDGDLDLIVNTVNANPLIYQNHTLSQDPSRSNYLMVRLYDSMSVGNKFAIGARLELYANGVVQSAEVAPARGFMSCVDTRLHFGLGTAQRVDSLVVYWAPNVVQTVIAPPIGTTLLVNRDGSERTATRQITLSSSLPWEDLPGWKHDESEFNDFDRHPLLLEMISAEGPALAVGVVNDSDAMLFVGGAKGQASQVYTWRDDSWHATDQPDLHADGRYEDVQAVWFDADGDDDADLFVGAGSHEFADETFGLRSRLYINDGRGRLIRSTQRGIGVDGYSCGALQAIDLNGDTHMDLLFGTHFRYNHYGLPSRSFALLNDGTGTFTFDKNIFPALDTLDRVRAIASGEFDGRPGVDLAIAREYGSVAIYSRTDAEWLPVGRSVSGLWRALHSVDLDGDGVDELLAGNLGTNSVISASAQLPLQVAIGDLDGNGTVEQITSMDIGGERAVVHQLFDLFGRMPALRKRFPRFSTYAQSSPEEFFGDWVPQVTWRAEELRSGVLSVDADTLTFEPLPPAVQRTCVRAIASIPSPEDAIRLYFAGNYSRVKPEIGGQMSGTGVCLKYDSVGKFIPCPDAPPRMTGEVRNLAVFQNQLLAARNDASLQYWISDEQ